MIEIKEDLKVLRDLPNTKEWCNTATSVLRELIEKHNKLVDRVDELKQRLIRDENLL